MATKGNTGKEGAQASNQNKNGSASKNAGNKTQGRARTGGTRAADKKNDR